MAGPQTNSFDQIAAGLYLEGLAVDHVSGTVWYSDVVGGGVHGVGSDGEAHSFDPARLWTGGVLLNEGGAVLSSGQGGIRWNDPETARSGWLLETLDGMPINGVNEMVPDRTGGIFFGTCDIKMVIKGEATRPTELWRLTADRQAIKLAEGVGFTNGLAYDASRRRLYCNDTFRGTWSFEVADDLTLGDRRFLLEKEDADGLALDVDGNLWITGFKSGFFTRIAPDGARLDDFETPAGAITQLRFGGDDGCDLYFNAVPTDGGEKLKEGSAISERGSFLLRGRSDTPGMAIEPARFNLV